MNVVSCSSGRGQIVLGDSSGLVHIVDKQWTVSSFPAYDVQLTHVHQCKQRNLLYTVGIDSNPNSITAVITSSSSLSTTTASPPPAPLIKIWNLDKSDKSKTPQCLRSIKIQTDGRDNVCSALAVLENFGVAVGLNNTVVLIKGDVVRGRFVVAGGGCG